MNEAWVNVRVDQYRAQPVYVLGEVMSPGQFVIKDEMYLTDLITLSGGFNEKATPTGFLYRRREPVAGAPAGDVPTDDAIAIDFAALNEGTRPELNVKLRGGDVLYVPERRRSSSSWSATSASPGTSNWPRASRAFQSARRSPGLADP